MYMYTGNVVNIAQIALKLLRGTSTGGFKG
jgi:hypothetical protein